MCLSATKKNPSQRFNLSQLSKQSSNVSQILKDRLHSQGGLSINNGTKEGIMARLARNSQAKLNA